MSVLNAIFMFYVTLCYVLYTIVCFTIMNIITGGSIALKKTLEKGFEHLNSCDVFSAFLCTLRKNYRDFWICWRSQSPCLRNSCRSCALRWMISLSHCHQCNPLPREKALSQFLMWHGQILEPWRMFGRSWPWQYWYVLMLLLKGFGFVFFFLHLHLCRKENYSCMFVCVYLSYNVSLVSSSVLQSRNFATSSFKIDFYNLHSNLLQVWCMY